MGFGMHGLALRWQRGWPVVRQVGHAGAVAYLLLCGLAGTITLWSVVAVVGLGCWWLVLYWLLGYARALWLAERLAGVAAVLLAGIGWCFLLLVLLTVKVAVPLVVLSASELRRLYNRLAKLEGQITSAKNQFVSAEDTNGCADIDVNLDDMVHRLSSVNGSLAGVRAAINRHRLIALLPPEVRALGEERLNELVQDVQKCCEETYRK